MPQILLLGTCDTKLHELLYLRSQILASGSNVRVSLVDCGRSPTQHEHITITQSTLTTQYATQSESSSGPKDLSSLPRGQVIEHMIACTTNYLTNAHQTGLKDPSQAIHGVIAAGGTGNTSLASAAMRAALPIGLPKLIVSTNASADVSPVVGETDIVMMPSIVDIAGDNELLRRILGNAAGAIVGMAGAYERSLTQPEEKKMEVRKKRVGLSMFGVTTPAVEKIREFLEANYPISCYIFHMTGTGGRAMERLVSEGALDAVCDVTTTELCDHICGGVMDAGPHRLEAALKAGIPYVISLGALDMCNFGPKATLPEKYQDRKLFEHNPTVTLMRTNVEESRKIGSFIVDKVKNFARDRSKVQVVMPMGGVSVIATPGAAFHDAEADKALFSTLRDGLRDSGVAVVEDGRAVNDESFAVDLAKRLVELMQL